MAVALTNLQRDSILHVVYEYAHLVSASDMLAADEKVRLRAPGIHHIQDAFLLGCRKMADFFQCKGRSTDVQSSWYLDHPAKFALTTWDAWKDAIDKQLAHITEARVTGPKSWDGSAVGPLFDELKIAWQTFLHELDPGV